jgi:GTP-binding protein Era
LNRSFQHHDLPWRDLQEQVCSPKKPAASNGESMSENKEQIGDIREGHKSGFVAVVGAPNAGKSTLLNQFMQQKIAIVTPRPQTTRTRQLGILTSAAYQIIFVDTPGIMKQVQHKLDKFMLESAIETLLDADVILWVVDASRRPGAIERVIAERIAPLVTHVPTILAINKSDLVPAQNVMAVTDAYRSLLPNSEWLFISATQALGTDDLLQMVVEALPEGPRFYPADQITDAYLRDIAAEMIREQILLQLREEIPHGVAVQIDQFKERENGTVYMAANVFVDRESHKKIVIGRNGSMLRAIGIAARKEIEEMVEGQVFLDLWVKVAPKWRQRERDLRRFGYTPPKS